jgi:hypothetical protein
MSKRRALLIGSLPFTDEETCMRRALAVFGSDLIALPDGRTPEQAELVLSQMQELVASS